MSDQRMRPHKPICFVETHMVNLMSDFKSHFIECQCTPHTEKEYEREDKKLMTEWLYMVARLGDWPPPFSDTGCP